jgi:hypothetical protein
MKNLAVFLIAGCFIATVFGGQALGVTFPSSGSLTVTGDGAGWPAEYGGGAYHSAEFDLTTLNGGNPVALRGWVDLRQTLMPDPGSWAKYYFGWHLIDMNSFDNNGWGGRYEVKANFTTDNLGGWHGIPPQPWERVRLESTNMAAPTGEEWYCTQGGTHDVAGGGPIYPTDQVYYFQMIVDPATRGTELWVYGKGNPGDGPAPNWNNAVDVKQWYLASTYTIPSEFDMSRVLAYPWLMASPNAPAGSQSTVRFSFMDIGESVSTLQAPPVPEPLTLAGLAVGAGALGGYIRRRRRV